MFKRMGFLSIPLVVLGLLVANIGVYTAHAHNWDGYHWNKGGNIYIYNYNTAVFWGDAEAARQDAWNQIPILWNYNINYHPSENGWHIHVFDGNWGNTGWSGLATIEDIGWDWGCWCFRHINHGLARYNSYYGYSAYWRQYVFCQEIFHTYGFQHDDSNGCMDYTPSTNRLVPHNVNDFYGRYQNH